ncbi:MAG: hypothetical protein GY856_52520 [bacterium]|nr:hypothetical protein [bacterium]
MAKALLASARTIAGELPGFEALALSWDGDIEEAHRKVREALRRLDRGDGVLILSDLYGATPSNVALAFRAAGTVEVISGVNLPMVVRLGCFKGQAMTLAETAEWIRDKGRCSICSGTDVPRLGREATCRKP